MASSRGPRFGLRAQLAPRDVVRLLTRERTPRLIYRGHPSRTFPNPSLMDSPSIILLLGDLLLGDLLLGDLLPKSRSPSSRSPRRTQWLLCSPQCQPCGLPLHHLRTVKTLALGLRTQLGPLAGLGVIFAPLAGRLLVALLFGFL
jgi:hypothetical protein